MRELLVSLLMIPTMMAAGGATTAAAEPARLTSSSISDRPPAPVAELLRSVEIPYDQFTLANGLRVIVHEDRKAPIVAVSVWYNVGSKDEPPGRTGFAHLFEHLMFNGSENAPGDYFEPLREVGATDFNGTTWFDRTNYFQTVPRPALERVLFLESDRMGHLLGAVGQETLTNQVGVVQNEKRQGDNQPFGLVEYAQLAALFPEGHPYRHATIGSMADLDAASLEDVRSWFRAKYGPNNAVLVLAGDISAAEARPLVERYFGDIPRGPDNRPAEAPVPRLTAPVVEVMKDRVANTRLYRNWAVPGLLDEDTAALTVAAGVLGGLSSSRLDNELVRKDQTAVRVSAENQAFHRVGIFEVQVDVKPGVEAERVAARLDAIIADLVANGPTSDEVQRVVTTEVAARIRGLEQVGGFGGKATALAEGALYADDPEFYRKQLLALGRVTPADVQRVLQKWLTRPGYVLTVMPGERGAYEEAAGKAEASPPPSNPPLKTAAAGDGSSETSPRPRVRRTPPPVGEIAKFDFPNVERSRLSNGIEVVYARRQAVPVVRIAAEFNAGVAADPANASGIQSLMLRLLPEGTKTRTSVQIAEEQERLGAQIQPVISRDRSALLLSALTPNLGRSLDLLADIVRNPAFATAEVERLRAQQLALIAEELTQPAGMAQRALPPLIYGADHPYGRPPSGVGSAAALRIVSREELQRLHQTWIRPDTATIFAVGDVPLATLVEALERRFGDWRASTDHPKGRKSFASPPPAVRARIVLVDRPQSPQSYIYAGQVLPVRGTDDTLELRAANEVLGGNFLSRINMDLRETKGWSYGARSVVDLLEDRSSLLLIAPVQADKTGPAVQALISHVRDLAGGRKIVPPGELQQVINANTRQLAGQFETSSAVLGALRSNALYRRPDNYWEVIADRYRALTPQRVDAAAQASLDPGKIVWIVVGDAARVRTQLEGLGLDVEAVRVQ